MNKAIKIWHNYIKERQQLFDNKIIRTFNNPVEDFSEWLVANYCDGQLACNVNQKDYDVEKVDMFIQVKSLAKDPTNPNGYIITKKDRDNQSATHYAFVFFDNYSPTAVYFVNVEFVKSFPKSQIKRENLDGVCLKTSNVGIISFKHQNNDLKMK
jgi:hypothetical protein